MRSLGSTWIRSSASVCRASRLQFHDFLSFVVLRFSFGAPISRNRVYLLLLRRDLMLKRCKENFAQFASGISEALGMKPECTWLSVCSLIGSP
jgi:hypothetical protein